MNSTDPQRILVTGGAGYIGSVVTAQLISAGYQVVVLDDLSTGYADAVHPAAELIVDDAANAGQVLASGIGTVLHFAARSLVGESVAEPSTYWHGNISTSLRLIEACRAEGVRRLVFSSTAAVYGTPLTEIIGEDHPTMPINPYGASKLAVDHMLAAEAVAYGLGAVSLRYFNVAGAYTGLGERHEPETHLIPNLLKAASGGGAPAKLFGTDYPTQDGTAVRDYIHVADLARAHLLALEQVEPGRHQVFNLGTGRGSSVAEVIAAVERVTGRRLPVERHRRRPGDPARLVASNAKARAGLGWAPQHSLDDMICGALATAERESARRISAPDATPARSV